eukprot:6572845-Prymnesium_polylepis.2
MDELAAAAAVLAMDGSIQMRTRRRFRRTAVARAAAMFSNTLLRGSRQLERRTRSILLNNGKPELTSTR